MFFLGVVRCKRNTTDEETTPSFVQERHVFAGMAYLLKYVCNDFSPSGCKGGKKRYEGSWLSPSEIGFKEGAAS